MNTRSETLRSTVDINVRGILNRMAEIPIRIWKSSEFDPIPVQAHTTSATSAKVRQTALYHNHPLASVSGLLEDHPLRDEYLVALEITE